MARVLLDSDVVIQSRGEVRFGNSPRVRAEMQALAAGEARLANHSVNNARYMKPLPCFEANGARYTPNAFIFTAA